MRAISKRLCKLEGSFGLGPGIERKLWVVTIVGRPLALDEDTCVGILRECERDGAISAGKRRRTVRAQTMRLITGLNALERRGRAIAKEPIRVIIRNVCGEPNLVNSTFRRTLDAHGQLTELVEIDGGLDGLTNRDLEIFIASVPIERLAT
jgi:hypothetical protein